MLGQKAGSWFRLLLTGIEDNPSDVLGFFLLVNYVNKLELLRWLE